MTCTRPRVALQTSRDSRFRYILLRNLFHFHLYVLTLLEIYWCSVTANVKMHHCDVLCLVISSLCSLQAYNYAEHLYNIFLFLSTSPDSTSPPTHFTRAPPSHAKNRYLNSRLMIFHASELATELTRSRVQDVRLRYRSRLQVCKATSVVASRHVMVTCMVLRNKNWRLTFSYIVTTGRDVKSLV